MMLASGEVVRLPACQSAAIAVISRFSHEALELEQPVLGVVPKGDGELRRLDDIVVGPRV